MTKGNTLLTLVGVAVFYAAAFGSLAYSAKTDPIGREPAVDVGVIGHEPVAYGAVHGIVIPPFRD